jgi:hypothetical protein
MTVGVRAVGQGALLLKAPSPNGVNGTANGHLSPVARHQTAF